MWVWYCRRCTKVYRAEPRGSIPLECKCRMKGIAQPVKKPHPK